MSSYFTTRTVYFSLIFFSGSQARGHIGAGVTFCLLSLGLWFQNIPPGNIVMMTVLIIIIIVIITEEQVLTEVASRNGP